MQRSIFIIDNIYTHLMAVITKRKLLIIHINTIVITLNVKVHRTYRATLIVNINIIIINYI
jgi:hypothetical protein